MGGGPYTKTGIGWNGFGSNAKKFFWILWLKLSPKFKLEIEGLSEYLEMKQMKKGLNATEKERV